MIEHSTFRNVTGYTICFESICFDF